MSEKGDLQDELIQTQARAMTDLVVRDALRPVSLGLGIFFAALTVSYFLRFSADVAAPLALAGAITAAILLGIRIMVGRKQISRAQADYISAAVAIILLANTVIQHWSVKPGQHTNFALLIVGASILLVSTRWQALVVGVISVVWVLTIRAFYPSVTAADFGAMLVPTVTLAWVVHTARTRALRQAESLRIQDRIHKADLERAIRALQQNEERYRRLSEAPFEGILFHTQGRILDANQTLLTMFGYELQEVIGRSTVEFVAPEYRSIAMQRATTHDDSPYEAIAVRRDGSRFPIEIRGKNAGYHGSKVRVVALRDITQRKQAEAALHEEQQRYKALFDRTNDAVFIVSPDGIHLAANQPAADLLGCSVEEIVGHKVEDFVAPEEKDAAHTRRMILMTGEVMPVYERLFRRKDGTTFPGEINAALVLDSEGKPLHIQSVVRDVTRRKQMEAEREEMIRDLENFAHTVAHDLKNPLGLVLAYAHLLREDIGSMPVETLREYVDRLIEGGVKMRTIIEELLLLAQTRYGEIQPTPIDMHPLIQAACERLALPSSDRSTFKMPEQWPPAMGYGPWIEEVWFNYLSNALKYGGHPQGIQLGADTQPGSQVRFWVRDDGPGLTPEQMAKLFVPFTQLQQVNSLGHGLGLSIVRHIVEKLGGQVGVESCVGQGSLFYFTLPSAVDDERTAV